MEPIDPDLIKRMNDLGKILGDGFKDYGFALLVFDFGFGGKMNYISNARRDDMIAALREFVAMLEGRVHEVNSTQ